MTHEEAIKWIEQIKNKYIHDGDEEIDSKRNKALDMAIQAIKKIEELSIVIKEDLERECLEHDSFDEYSEGRYDILSRLNQIICADDDRAISLNEWHEQAKDVKYSANNSTTICVKPQDREPMYYPQVEGITPTVVAQDKVVSLNAVLDAICKICEVEAKPSECKYRKGLFGGCKEYEAIKAIPSVESKIGHWRAVYQGDEIINYRCSECEIGDTNGSTLLYGWNYCRRCGAKMIEPQERSE